MVAWLVLLVAFGVFAGLDSLSVLTLVPLLVVVVMLWPLYALAPWRPGLADRVIDRTVANRWGILGAFAVGRLRVFPVTPDLLVRLLDLPFRSAGMLFGAKLFYAERLGPRAGDVVLLVAAVLAVTPTS